MSHENKPAHTKVEELKQAGVRLCTEPSEAEKVSAKLELNDPEFLNHRATYQALHNHS